MDVNYTYLKFYESQLIILLSTVYRLYIRLIMAISCFYKRPLYSSINENVTQLHLQNIIAIQIVQKKKKNTGNIFLINIFTTCLLYMYMYLKFKKKNTQQQPKTQGHSFHKKV